ncbi:MAG: tripartite tricarboxylate transporter TctB family protein [Ruminococcaceae bacterium]|nr:tripartite tricarboxylate transporter TctB family protein [Oscillospiraceae bacterium]
MNKLRSFVYKIDAKLDDVGSKLAIKQINIPIELIAAILFLVVAIILLLLMPSQVTVKDTDVVNGRVFPTYLFGMMIIGSTALIMKEIVHIIRKEPIATKTVNLLTEVKALVIFGIMILYFVICIWTDLFVIGAIVCALAFQLFFRCKKPSYYVITVAAAIVIWAAFRFVLGVRF